ncbi:NAD(P)-binding protein [Aspergillus brunneoviolaceus CBS 621.78]|uniref:NAD(P)-binding protein n=1 Tax=Aspergillus brunneoviolaceus CBS 621.78 TaxID=1450534 RepID=A0ACD1G695_9EURO|nr:NAD(P)-binding protein [Aspergillus brunneoviolaceus CBS 621.78]RAH44787.1 NAD(P)-binding protein [Aspergillus brunneoviolaceus CBS 621.78]
MAPFTGLRAALTQIYPPKPGRVYIVTGGNVGIGLELVKILYAGGATIYIASRSKAKVEAAIQAITSPSSNTPTTSGKFKFLHLDLNDPKTVTAAAASFAEQESKLDVLWNNAGTGANTVPLGERTAQDFELFISRHCIATLLFTHLLLPQLRAAAAVGSPPNGIDWAVIDQGTNKLAQNYGVSKAGTWFLSREFARRYKKDGIVSVCLNPGYLKTASFNGTPALVMFIINRLMLSESIYGAYTELFAGLSPEVTLENSGAYIIPWGRVRPDSATGRQDLIKAGALTEEGGLGYGAKLWEWCEKQWAPYV